MKGIVKNIIAVFIGIFLALCLAELVLQIYNPFHTRIKSGKIVLPTNVSYQYHLKGENGLGKHIIHKKNSIGFRGPEWQEKDIRFRIFCVGGSTTECFYLNDGKDWPAVLENRLNRAPHETDGVKFWVNNAGLDGHSTFGHKILLQDHLLRYKPGMVIFLVGCNDVAADGINKYEKYHLYQDQRWLAHFELFHLYNGWRMARAASRAGMGHTPVKWLKQPLADTSGWRKMDTGEAMLKNIEAYKKRLVDLGELCLSNNVVPVFVTQPCVFSEKADPQTGICTGRYAFLEKSGLHYLTLLRQYNECTRDLCKEKKWTCVEAADLMPAETRYYYDFFHYNNSGAAFLANLVFQELSKSIK